MALVRISTLPQSAFETFLERPLLDGFEVEPESLGPGKFESAENPALAERLHNVSLEGWAEEQAGNVDESGVHLARVGRFILIENAQGSVTYVAHPSTRAAQSNFSILAGDVEGEEVEELPEPARSVAFPPLGHRLSSDGMTKLLEEIKASAVPGSAVREYQVLQAAIASLGMRLLEAERRDREQIVSEA